MGCAPEASLLLPPAYDCLSQDDMYALHHRSVIMSFHCFTVLLASPVLFEYLQGACVDCSKYCFVGGCAKRVGRRVSICPIPEFLADPTQISSLSFFFIDPNFGKVLRNFFYFCSFSYLKHNTKLLRNMHFSPDQDKKVSRN